jgi:hypothetical protein
MPTYHSGLPHGCPPTEAVSMTGAIYRKVIKPPHTIGTVDFYSSREKGDTAPDADCQRWGTSVWINKEHVKHDLELFTYLQKHRIVSVEVTPSDGVIQHTPTDKRPHHRTFWRDCNVDFPSRCMIIYSPDEKEIEDAL